MFTSFSSYYNNTNGMYCFVSLQVDGATSTGESLQYEMVSIESQSELDRRKAGMSLSLSPVRQIPPNITTPHDNEEESGMCVCMCVCIVCIKRSWKLIDL